MRYIWALDVNCCLRLSTIETGHLEIKNDQENIALIKGQNKTLKEVLGIICIKS